MTSTIATHPRAVILALLAAGLMLGLITGLAVLSPKSASADGHITGLENIVVGDVVVDHEAAETVRIWGSGFAPGQEVILLVNDGPGTPSDITGFTTNGSGNGTMVANERGAWATVWTVGRLTRQRSGIGPGDGDVERVRTLAAIDPSTFDTVASTPLAFCQTSDRASQRAEIATPLNAAQLLRNEIEAHTAELATLREEIEALGVGSVAATARAREITAELDKLAAEFLGIPAQIEAHTGTVEALTSSVEAALGEIVTPAHCPS